MVKYKHKKLGYVATQTPFAMGDSYFFTLDTNISYSQQLSTISRELVENSCDWEKVQEEKQPFLIKPIPTEDGYYVSSPYQVLYIATKISDKWYSKTRNDIDNSFVYAKLYEEWRTDPFNAVHRVFISENKRDAFVRIQNNFLFITEDNVEITDTDQILYTVTKDNILEIPAIRAQDKWKNADIYNSPSQWFYSTYPAAILKYNSLQTPKVLLTTEDGVKIYDEDKKLYTLFTNWGTHRVTAKNAGCAITDKYFSTKEARDNYILNNKPLLALGEIKAMMNDIKRACRFSETNEARIEQCYQNLVNLVKSKL